MTEYKTNIDSFKKNTRNRVVIEVAIFVLLLIFFLVEQFSGIQNWLKFSVLGFFLFYIIYGVYSYPKTKEFVKDFTLHLYDNSLGFSTKGKINKIPYHEIRNIKITKHDDQITSIKLKTSFGQKMVLKNFEKLDEIYQVLSKKVVQK